MNIKSLLGKVNTDYLIEKIIPRIQNVRKKDEKLDHKKLGSIQGPFTGNQWGVQPSNVVPGFSREKSIKQFKSWVYALSLLVGKACSHQPLKLYIIKNRNKKCIYQTRKLSANQNLYLKGYTQFKPSASVIQKARTSSIEEVVEKNKITDLLNNVNPYMTKTEFMILLLLYTQIVGTGYIHPILDSNGVPAELWILPSQWVNVIPGNMRLGEDFIKSYRVGRGVQSEIYAPEEIISIYNARDLGDLYFGQSHTEAAFHLIQLDASRRLLEQSWLNNLARPDWIIFLNSGDQEAINKYEAQINAKLRGGRNTGRVMVTGSTADIEMKQLNFTDTPFNTGKTSKGSAESALLYEMCAIWGVPVGKVLANSQPRANARTQEYSFSKDTILPYLNLIQEALNERLLPLFGVEDEAFLAFDSPVPLDKEQILKESKELQQAGIITVNEARELNGYSPLDDEKFDLPKGGGQIPPQLQNNEDSNTDRPDNDQEEPDPDEDDPDSDEDK